ncbi:MAG: RNA 2',3'-cyclic phosphodiesterase [Planctomycetes bacterium]|nr:RNA 2',3'-cyclic phosphodiesterase [Planctomycetota bacterium]
MVQRPSHSAGSHRIRAFIAVDLDEEVKHALRPVLKRVRERCGRSDVKWLPEENWHLTVKFLGDVPWLEVGRVGKLMQAVAAEAAPFELRVEGLGAFPPGRAPRIVSAGIVAGGAELAKLHAALDASLATMGIPPENRGFKAHLTLGRVRGHAEMLWEALREYEAAPFGACEVDKLVLYQSELESRGAQYTALASGKLGR